METKLILYRMPSMIGFTMAKSLHRTKSSPPSSASHSRPLSIICATVSPDSNSDGSTDAKGKESSRDASNSATQRRESPATLTIRYRARSRSQAKKEQQKLQQGLQKAPIPPKKWEDMTLSEKTLELYVGEKGLLFWLNKFAYASIFAVIGGWILFRFVGPSLGLYQLDSPPLSPTSIFKD
ncbi:hypothetical protein KSP39_PZI012684 [Platanthera zijinensis]|uniref:Uncharacterized protein n=1 Tax=Platanthera zijinensis TaxID=2320716 RepID=A0AAP0BEF6_9ASPA